MLSIEDYYESTDGNDWSPAWDRVQATYLTQITGNANADKRRFTTFWRPILFPAGLYTFSRTMDVFGAWIQGQQANTTLKFTNPDLDCVRLHCPQGVGGTAPLYLDGPGGSHPSKYGGVSILENITIQGIGKRRGVGAGVRAYKHFDARNVTLDDIPAGGWIVSGDHNRPEKSNVNRFTMVNCRALSCGGDGLFVDGGDSSAGYTREFRAQSCDGWGIWDSSFLGNLHVAPSSVLNGTGPIVNTVPEVQLAYYSDYPGASNVFINPYVEGYGALIDVVPKGLVIGGVGGLLSARTTRWNGSSVTGPSAFSGPGGVLSAGKPDTVFDFVRARVEGQPIPQPYSVQAIANAYSVELGRVNVQAAFQLTDTGLAGYEAGRLIFPFGYYEGTSGVKRITTTAFTPPTPAPADLREGSTCRTTKPRAGQPFEWVLMADRSWVPTVVLPAAPPAP